MRRARRRRRPERGPGACAAMRRADHGLRRQRRARSVWSTDYDRARATRRDRRCASCCDAALDVLATFADICELSRNRPAGEEESGDERVHSPREYFHSYLQSLDVEREGLPEAFRTRLAAVPSPLRRRRISSPGTRWRRRSTGSSWRRSGPPTRSRSSPGCSSGGCDDGCRRVRRGHATDRRGRRAAGGRDPAALPGGRRPGQEHPVRGCSSEPLIEQAREQVYARRPRAPAAPRRRTRRCRRDASGSRPWWPAPSPLIRLLAEQLTSHGPGPEAMLEAMTRRYYQVRTLEDVEAFRARRPAPVTGDFELSGERLHLISTRGRLRRPAGRPAHAVAGAGRAASRPAERGHRLYLAWPDAPADADRSPRPCDDAAGHVPVAGRRPPGHRHGVRPAGTECCSSPSGRGHGPGGGTGHPRHAPADRSAAGPVAAEELQRHPAAVGRGHLPVPLVAPTTRPTSGSSRWPRSGTSPRCGTPTARSSRSRPPSGCSLPAWRASAGRRRGAAASSGWTTTGSSCTCGRPSRCRWTTSPASRRRARR